MDRHLSAPHYRRPLLDTPFAARAHALQQRDAFVAWSGYSTVDVYTSVEQEYFAIRNGTTLYDLTPMVKYRVAGPDAERYLNRLVTRDIRKLRPGRVSYVVWCNDDGQIIDDGTVFRFGPQDFRICTADRQIDWFLDSAIGFKVDVEDVTEDIAALSMQGPTSCYVLKRFGLAGIEALRPFELGSFSAAGRPLMVSRTGFTGDLGYEIWMRPEHALSIWDDLMEAGRTRGIRPIGSQALNMARIEAGFIMPNVEFVSAEHTLRLGRERTPYELGLGWLVDLDKPHFNGRRALAQEAARGSARMLVGLDVAGNKPAHGALLYAEAAGKKEIGHVTSALWSPTCKRNIALALVERPYFEIGTPIWADVYLHRELLWERRMLACQVTPRPFFAPERRRLTPPADR